MAQSRPCSHPNSQSCSPPKALASVLQSQILLSSTLQSSILQSGNPPFWDLAVMRSCSHEILQSRSKIPVPLVRSCCHGTVQTLQSSHQPVLQSSKCTCNCLAVPNLAVINLAVICLAVTKPTHLGSCSHEILQS